MTLAMFTPTPPKKTGIAYVAAHLIDALSKAVDVHVFDTNVEMSHSLRNIPVIDFIRNPEHLKSLDMYDNCIFHLGNNPWYHIDSYRVLLDQPGIVVLHDTILYYLIAGLGIGGMVKEFCLNYGVERIDELWSVIDNCPGGDILRYQHPDRYPFLQRVFDQATAIVVHSQTAKQRIIAAGYQRRIEVINLLSGMTGDIRSSTSDAIAVRRELGLSGRDVLIGCFGFIGPTKRLPALIHAFDRIHRGSAVKLLIAGEGDTRPIDEEIARRGLDDEIIRLDYLSDEDFARYLMATDIVVNLRYPSMGETSATLLQAMSQRKACIVTDDAWFSEIPDACVVKVKPGDGEVDDLTEALLELIEDPVVRAELGANAREYIELGYTPGKVAGDYLRLLREADVQGRHLVDPIPISRRDAVRPLPSETEPGWVQDYLLSRTLRALPTSGAA